MSTINDARRTDRHQPQTPPQHDAEAPRQVPCTDRSVLVDFADRHGKAPMVEPRRLEAYEWLVARFQSMPILLPTTLSHLVGLVLKVLIPAGVLIGNVRITMVSSDEAIAVSLYAGHGDAGHVVSITDELWIGLCDTTRPARFVVDTASGGHLDSGAIACPATIDVSGARVIITP